MELVDRVFSQKIVDKYTNLKLFTANFAPIISTRRVIPHKRWLELVYAMPYLVLRREILNSFKRTKNVFASAKQIWNILVRFDFPRSRYDYITTRSHRFSRENRNIQYPGSKIQVKPLSGIQYPLSSPYVNLVNSRGFYFESSSMALAQPVSHETTRIETESAFTNYLLPLVTQQPLVVIHKPSAVSYINQDFSIHSGTSDFIAQIFRFYSFRPLSFLRQKTAPVKLRGVSLIRQKSDVHYGHLEPLQKGQKIISYLKSSSMALAQPLSHKTATTRAEKDLAIQNYQLQLVSPKPSAVSNNNIGTYIPHGTSDFINISSFNIINKKNEQKQLGIEEVPLYHTYPRIEHVTYTHTELIKEKVIEKEDKPLQATPQLPSFDLNRLTDQVYQLLERKIRIERERRGLLCR